jgi:hypothetical protein
MVNALEVTPLKARFPKALTAIAAGLVAGLPLAAGAQNTSAPQQRGTPDPNAPRVVVTIFRAADKNGGVQAPTRCAAACSRSSPTATCTSCPSRT